MMMKRLLANLLALGLGLTPFAALPADESGNGQRPLFEVYVSFEMSAIEQSVERTSQSIDEISVSLRQIAAGESLTEEQKEQLARSVDSINRLVEVSTRTAEALPSLVQSSREQLAANGQAFFDNLKFWFLVIMGIIVAALVVVIACLYWIVLRPMQETLLEAVRNIAGMAKSMETTARSLEISNQTHREILDLAARLQPPSETSVGPR